MKSKMTACFIWATVAVCALLQGCGGESLDDAIRNGQTALRSGDYKTAATHLKRAAKLNPESSPVFYNLGMAQLYANQLPAAAKSFEKAATLNRDTSDTAALEGLAETRRRQGRFEDALKVYERAEQETKSLSPRAMAGNAACQMALGNDAVAKTLLDQALLVDKKNPVANFNMAVLMQKNAYRDNAAAAICYANFLTFGKADEYPRERERAAKAMRDIGDARPLALEDKIDELMMKSAAAKKRGNVREAIRFANEAVKADSSHANALWALVTLLREPGVNQEPFLKFCEERFRKVFPDDPRAGQ